VIADFVRGLPAPLRAPFRVAGVHTGKHRGPRAMPVPGALVGQAFRFCEPCGVETAVVVHANGTTSCTEDHRVTDGDPT
jgi:hypothetical protein